MLYLLVILGAVAFDQITKYWAQNWLMHQVTFPVIKDFFHLTYAQNTGAAFSFLKGRQMFLVLTTFLIIAFAAGLLYRSMKTGDAYPFMLKLALAFIIGGAIGNLIDRMRLGYVVDFFDFRAINFAIFNVADSFIVVGTILVAGLILFKDIKL